MTVPTNTYQKASLKGNREDLLDKINSQLRRNWG